MRASFPWFTEETEGQRSCKKFTKLVTGRAEIKIQSVDPIVHIGLTLYCYCQFFFLYFKTILLDIQKLMHVVICYRVIPSIVHFLLSFPSMLFALNSILYDIIISIPVSCWLAFDWFWFSFFFFSQLLHLYFLRSKWLSLVINKFYFANPNLNL